MSASRPVRRRIAGVAVLGVLAAAAVTALSSGQASASPIISISPNAAVNNFNGDTRVVIRTTQPFSPVDSFVTFTRVDSASSQPTSESVSGTIVNETCTAQGCVPTVTGTRDLQVDANFFNSNPGQWDVKVESSDPDGDLTGVSPVYQADECTRCFTTLTPNAPFISSVNSPRLSANTTVSPVTVTGGNFANASRVDFLLAGVVDTKVTFSRSGATTTSISGSVRTAGDAQPGFRDLRVTNTDGLQGTCPNCVSISAINVTGVSPNAGANTEIRRLAVTGTGFPADAVVQLIKETQTGQGPITGGNTVVSQTNRLDADFDLRGAQTGTYFIRVQTQDGQSANNLACSPRFTIVPPGGQTPSPTPSVTPSSSATGTCQTIGASAPPTASGTPASPSSTASPTVTPTSTVSVSPSASASVSQPPGNGRFVPVNPERVLDTREGLNTTRLPIGSGETRSFTVTGRANIPAGATAVALNVTAIDPTRSGYLTVFPAGTSRPLASNLNFVPGDVIANLVIVRIGSSGQVSLYNNAGSTHVAADVVGYYGPANGGSAYSALNPERILDTRDGNGGSAEPIGSGESRSLQITGRGGVPATATAVALNLTAITPSANGFLTAYPSGTTRPIASNLNFKRADTIANLVIVRIGGDGKINIFNNSGFTDTAADVVGYFSETGGSEALYTSLFPERILDTRSGTGGPSQPIGPGESRELQVTGTAGVPSNATAVVFNLTAISPSSSGFFTAFPTGTFRPTASNINFVRGDVIPNLVIVRVGVGGKVNIYNNSGFANAAADVVGYFVGTTASATPSATVSSTSTASPTASVTATATTTPSASTSATVSTTPAAYSGPAGEGTSGTAGLLGLTLLALTGGAGFLFLPRLAGAGHYRRRH